MKKLLFIALLVSSLTYAQNSAPELEINGNQVKATYYFENGAIQQVGHFLNGKLEGNTIFFLDAHWYTNPVLNELDAIKESGKKPIIAIHDFMVPDHPEFGYDIYPDQNIVYNWEWIQGKIESIYGKSGYTKEYNNEATGAMRGCIFLFPNK
jgi:antitoxin component YwqK of YwqJK toxin-antitoxin module